MVSIRQARADDRAAICAVARSAYAPYVERMGRVPAPVRADYEELIRRGHVWVAEVDGAVAGLIVLLADADHLLLENVAVRPETQGSGVGGHLLAFAEGQAVAWGLAEVRLYTNEAMAENLTYYPHHGYAETHRAVEDGYRRVFFSKLVRPDSDSR